MAKIGSTKEKKVREFPDEVPDPNELTGPNEDEGEDDRPEYAKPENIAKWSEDG